MGTCCEWRAKRLWSPRRGNAETWPRDAFSIADRLPVRSSVEFASPLCFCQRRPRCMVSLTESVALAKIIHRVLRCRIVMWALSTMTPSIHERPTSVAPPLWRSPSGRS
jgi:hypothetical protein